MAEHPQDTPLSIERTMIRKALEQAHRDKALAARLLGISQTELQSRMQVYGLTRPNSGWATRRVTRRPTPKLRHEVWASR